jgi:hypothetical protein
VLIALFTGATAAEGLDERVVRHFPSGEMLAGHASLIDGSPEVLSKVLDSPFLNEGHVLQALSRITLPGRVVVSTANHVRWSNIYAVRLALLRKIQTPLAPVLAFLPGISVTDSRILSTSTSVPSKFQPHMRRELTNRMQHGSAKQRDSRI